APSVWPVAPFVEEMNGRLCSVKTSLRTRVSAASPAGVEVPCAFTYPICAGSSWASVSAIRTARAALVPIGSRSETSLCVGGESVAGELGVDAGVSFLCVFEFLEHEDGGGFGDHEAVACSVEGA